MEDMPEKPELSEFLRSRRGRLRPVDVGLPERGYRRVPGLRREEVAALAGMSTDYYVRLEQGRNISASAEVLDALARALRLDDTERLHLHDLAKRRPARQSTPPPQRVRPGVQLLIDSLAQPAFVLGRRTDVLATNRLARALLTDFDALPAPERNHARWLFLNPDARELYGDWETVARENVAILRMDAGRHPDDTRLTALIGELSTKSPEFARWWADHDVLVRGHGTKRYRHPIVGELDIRYEALGLADEDQTLFVYSVEPESTSASALALLDSWSATPSPRNDELTAGDRPARSG